MAAPLLVHTAAVQLRSLLQLSVCSLQLRGVLQQSVCCLYARARCHQSPPGSGGDGKKNHRQEKKETGSRKQTFAVSDGSALSLKQLQGQEGIIQERSNLQCRIDLLVSLGCTMDQIDDRHEILKCSETEILKRAAMLWEYGRSPITVNLLMFAKHNCKKKLVERLQLWDSLDDALCSVLQCSLQELSVLKTKHQCLTRFRAVRANDIRERFDILHSFGVTREEVKAFPQVLKVKAPDLQMKIKQLKELREEGKLAFNRYPLPLLSVPYHVFSKTVNRIMAQKVEIDGTKIKLETIAQRLGVDATDLKASVINFHKINHTRVLAKLDYLLAAGIGRMDIMSHIYILKNSLERLKESVEKAKSISMDHIPNLFIVLSLLRSKRLPRTNYNHARQRVYISCLLQTPISSFPPSSPELRPLWSAQRHVIKQNFDFLTSEGFGVDNILSCMMVLAHDPPTLRSYYSSMWSRPEVVPYKHSQVWQDKNCTLALLQYLMEKDMNFASTVFHADVEYEQRTSPISMQVHRYRVTRQVKNTGNSEREHESYAGIR